LRNHQQRKRPRGHAQPSLAWSTRSQTRQVHHRLPCFAHSTPDSHAAHRSTFCHTALGNEGQACFSSHAPHAHRCSTAGVQRDLLMEERREADPAGTPRPEALHVYGVDLVGTRDLLNFFSVYGPTFVEWINDSSCNVLFPDEFTVKRLLVQLGEALSAEDVAKVEGAPSCHKRT
jgi:hypothetical protein